MSKIKRYLLEIIQGMNILFVCSRNNWRSPTAEAIYKSRQDHVCKSAGTEPAAKKRLTAKDIVWADIIFAMEKKHKQRIVSNFPMESKDKNIIILEIEDEYEYMDEELVDMIRRSVDSFL